MRFIYFFTILCLLVCLGTSSPLNPKGRLVNRPSAKEIFDLKRFKRNHMYSNEKERQHTKTRSFHDMETNLRKGEFIQDGRVHLLQRGVVPKGCNGLCQHSI